MRLSNNQKQLIRGHQGFTLLEMVATIGIIAILASMVLPRYNRITAEAKISKTQMNVVTLRNGFANYYYERLLATGGIEFVPAPNDSIMTNQWASQPILADNRTPASLFSENKLIYNPNGNPYMYYEIPADSINRNGFAIKDPDYQYTVEFRP